MCFGCSKEPSLQDGSFGYPQHILWLRNKEIIFSYAIVSGGLSDCGDSPVIFTFSMVLLASRLQLFKTLEDDFAQ